MAGVPGEREGGWEVEDRLGLWIVAASAKCRRLY